MSGIGQAMVAPLGASIVIEAKKPSSACLYIVKKSEQSPKNE
jgi:hypothetical protein